MRGCPTFVDGASETCLVHQRLVCRTKTQIEVNGCKTRSVREPREYMYMYVSRSVHQTVLSLVIASLQNHNHRVITRWDVYAVYQSNLEGRGKPVIQGEDQALILTKL